MSDTPSLGVHLACLNLFREPDGSHEITVASGAFPLLTGELAPGQRPIDLIEELVVEAAERMRARRLARTGAAEQASSGPQADGPEQSAPALDAPETRLSPEGRPRGAQP